MADLSDFFPLFDKDEETVYAEMAARANEGVEPDDPEWVDTRIGSFFYLTNYPAAVGIAAAYSRMNEAAAAGIVATSWETYLDLHAESYGTERKAATYATGEVVFKGAPGELVVSSGVRVTVQQTDPDVDPPIFETTASGSVPAALAGAPATSPVTYPVGGALTVGQIYQYVITAVDTGGGETVASSTVAGTPPDSGHKGVTVNWSYVSGALKYRVYRRTGTSGVFQLVAERPGNSYDDLGAVAPNPLVVPPSVATTGTQVVLPVIALELGAAGNVAAGAISQLDTGVPGVISLSNALPLSGGTEVESDPALKTRLAQRFGGGKGANKAWYAARALEEPGVSRVTVVANWDAPGDVLIIIMDENGRAVSTSVVESLQTRLDPVPGAGEGEAPIDHAVTVRTPTVLLVNVKGTPSFKPGYSLDGDGGTVAIRNELTAAIRGYIDALSSGDDVIFNAVEAAYFEVEGLLNVSGVQIQFDGGSWVSADLAVSVDPAQVVASNNVLFV